MSKHRLAVRVTKQCYAPIEFAPDLADERVNTACRILLGRMRTPIIEVEGEYQAD